MQDAEKKKFWKFILDALVSYQQKPNGFFMDVWWNVCKDYDFEWVQEAIHSWCSNPVSGKFAPKPADVAELL